MCLLKDKERKREREKGRKGEREKEREKEIKREREKERKRDREKERKRETNRWIIDRFEIRNVLYDRLKELRQHFRDLLGEIGICSVENVVGFDSFDVERKSLLVLSAEQLHDLQQHFCPHHTSRFPFG